MKSRAMETLVPPDEVVPPELEEVLLLLLHAAIRAVAVSNARGRPTPFLIFLPLIFVSLGKMSRAGSLLACLHPFGEAAGRPESVSALAASAGHASGEVNLVGIEVVDDGRDRPVAL